MRLLATLGWNPKIVSYSVEKLQPEEVVIFYGDFMGFNSEKALKELEEEIREVEKVKIDPMDIRDCITKMRPYVSQEAVANITGGTKIMALTLALLSAIERIPMVYVVTREGRMRMDILPLEVPESARSLRNEEGSKRKVLELLCHKYGGAALQDELIKDVRKALKLSEGASTVYEAIGFLEHRNLVKRWVNGEDRRKRFVQLTSAAHFFMECDTNE